MNVLRDLKKVYWSSMHKYTGIFFEFLKKVSKLNNSSVLPWGGNWSVIPFFSSQRGYYKLSRAQHYSGFINKDQFIRFVWRISEYEAKFKIKGNLIAKWISSATATYSGGSYSIQSGVPLRAFNYFPTGITVTLENPKRNTHMGGDAYKQTLDITVSYNVTDSLTNITSEAQSKFYQRNLLLGTSSFQFEVNNDPLTFITIDPNFTFASCNTDFIEKDISYKFAKFLATMEENYGNPISLDIANNPIPFEHTNDDGTMNLIISDEKSMFNTDPSAFMGAEINTWITLVNEYQGDYNIKNFRTFLYDSSVSPNELRGETTSFGNFSQTTIGNISLGLEFIHDGGPQSGESPELSEEFTSILNTDPQNFLGAKIIPNIFAIILRHPFYDAQPMIINPIVDSLIEGYDTQYGKIFFSDNEEDYVEFPIYTNFVKDIIAEYRTINEQVYAFENMFSPDSEGAYLDSFEIRPFSYFGYENSDGEQVYNSSTGEQLVNSIF